MYRVCLKFEADTQGKHVLLVLACVKRGGQTALNQTQHELPSDQKAIVRISFSTGCVEKGALSCYMN